MNKADLANRKGITLQLAKDILDIALQWPVKGSDIDHESDIADAYERWVRTMQEVENKRRCGK